MSLNDVSATLSTDGSTRIILTHRPTQVALQDPVSYTHLTLPTNREV